MQNEFSQYVNTKKLPKKYLILKLKMEFNKDLYDKKIINYDIYRKMQEFLNNKIDKVVLEYKQSVVNN